MEKSRRRREAAGKMPRRRRLEVAAIGNGMMTGLDGQSQQNQPLWSSQGVQSSILGTSTNGYSARECLRGGSSYTKLTLSILSEIPSGVPLHSPIPQNITTSTNAFSTISGTDVTHATLNGASISSANESEPFDNMEPLGNQPMPEDMPSPSNPEPQQPGPPVDPAATEADNRAAIWQEHGDTIKQIKDDIDSMLATLWAKDTDPRDLQNMFATLKEEVKQTRMRLLP